MSSTSRARAREVFAAALKAADPAAAVVSRVRIGKKTIVIGGRSVPLPSGGIIVLGAGKAAAGLARGLEKLLKDRIADGAIVVPEVSSPLPRTVRVYAAGHPHPDSRNLRAAREVLRIAESAGPDDLVICLISGGGSSLLFLPHEGVGLREVRRLNTLLLKSGASIREINAVRKRLSRLGAGRLARTARPARVLSLIVSDVVGDEIAAVASGPTSPDPVTFREARQVLVRYGLNGKIGSGLRRYFQRGLKGKVPETPKPGDRIFRRVENHLILDNRRALSAAGAEAKRLGYRPLLLSSTIEGDTRQAALFHAAVVREILTSGRPVSPPAGLISGGETTVEVKGKGRGGRNQEFVLALAAELGGLDGVTILSAGTDGIDGPTDAAGAVLDAALWKRAAGLGIDPKKYLGNNDSYNFFRPLGALLKTGPTGTNVNDVRVILIDKSSRRPGNNC